MRLSILEAISNAKDVTNAVILTHNIDFLFLQSVVIPVLRSCGSPALTVFADAGCAAESYAVQHRLVSGLGTRFRVVPVAMPAPFRFHPKAILLSGPSRGTLFVGSGNLTFGGWRDNGEIWSQFDTDLDGTGAFAAFQNYLGDLLRLVPLADAVRDQIGETFDPQSRAWASELATPSGLIGRAGAGASLLEQMRTAIAERPVRTLYACAPFFDRNGEAIQQLSDAIGAESTTLLVQEDYTTLSKAAARRLGEKFELKSVGFQIAQASKGDEPPQVRKAALHSKFFGAVTGDEVIVFAGSANCSRAALSIAGAGGNAELMTVATMPIGEFQAGFLGELLIHDSAPELPEAVPEEEGEDPAMPSLSITAARCEAGVVNFAYRSGSATTLLRAEVDGETVEVVPVGPGVARANAAPSSHTIVLIARSGATELRSAPHWIDQESSLRASARSRSLINAIESKVRSEVWGINPYAELLAELHRHVQYVPKSSYVRRRTEGGEASPPDSPTFRREDAFSSSCSLPLRAMSLDFAGRRSDDLDSLRAIIRRWFGARANDGGPESDSAELPVDEDLDENDEKDGDRPVRLKPSPAQSTPPPAESERRRVRKLAELNVEEMLKPDFIEKRDPEQISGSLCIFAALLRIGVFNNWLSAEDFFELTLKIWRPYFFEPDTKGASGRIEQRLLKESDEFRHRLCSPHLSAALTSWSLSVPQVAATPDLVRFRLASMMSISRLPWLWRSGMPEEIAREVADLVSLTSSTSAIPWNDMEEQWETLAKHGDALRQLESAISDLTPAELQGRLRQTEVSNGEVLWQGDRGFCVAQKNCSRTALPPTAIPVLVLRSDDTVKFRSDFLIPISDLVRDSAVLGSDELSQASRESIWILATEIRTVFAQNASAGGIKVTT